MESKMKEVVVDFINRYNKVKGKTGDGHDVYIGGIEESNIVVYTEYGYKISLPFAHILKVEWFDQPSVMTVKFNRRKSPLIESIDLFGDWDTEDNLNKSTSFSKI